MTQGQGGGPKIRTLTQDQIIQVEALSACISVDQMADYLSVSKTTFYQIMKRQPEVSARYKKGRAYAIKDIATGLIQDAVDGDNVARIFYLKTQAGWREKDSDTGGTISPINIIMPHNK